MSQNRARGGGALSRYDPPKTAYSEFSCFQKRKAPEYPWDDRFTSHLSVDPQRRLDWAPSLDDVKNLYGCIRWYKIRQLYFNHLVDLSFCVDAYREWRDTREDLWLDAINTHGDMIGSVFVVASKRGNQWYKERLNHKFSFFEELPPIHFFCEDWGHKTTPMLFVTPTIAPELVGYDLDQAWDQISLELHVFETKLRQEYGRFVKLRVWEAHESGFPHCHIVYYFINRTFEVWEHYDKKKGILTGNRSYRVSNAVRDKIRSFWGLGNIDIQGVSDTIGALSEVKKYVTKTIWGKKGDLTNTLCSLHNKQVYWLSQNDPFPLITELQGCSEEYILDRLRDLASHDFIGAIWGPQSYMDFYKKLHKHGFDEGLAEPGLSALVSRALHSCNKELPEFDHFEFKGCFKHEDLALLLPLSDDEISVLDRPPDDVRLLFGVDRVILSGSSGKAHFRDPDALEVFD